MNSLNRRAFLAVAGSAVAAQAWAPGVAAQSPSDTIRVGVIGVGGRGSVLLNTLLGIPGVQVVAICDLKADRIETAQQLVAEKGQTKPWGTPEWKKLLEKEGVDAVISALPVDLHAACYLDVIAAGKDLYGEKPLCMTIADCDKVAAAAKGSQQIVQIGFQRRADPRFIETMKQVHQGELGQLVEGRVAWSNDWGPLMDWFGLRRRSGDWMVEQAVHNWDIMNWANNCRPVRACGLGRSGYFKDRQPDRDVHDYYSGVLEYENGVIVNIIHSWLPPKKFGDEYSRLIGTQGGVDFNTGVFSYRRELEKPDRVGHHFEGAINNTKLGLEAFVKSVRTRQAPVATVDHGRAAVATCLLMRTAVYERRMVTLDEVLKA
jgi:predicted dehydrogenase